MPKTIDTTQKLASKSYSTALFFHHERSKDCRKLISIANDLEFPTVRKNMSMNLGLNRVQEVLIMGLMIVLVFAMFSGMELTDKISIGVIVFALIFLTTMANQLLEQMKERSKQ